MRDWLIVADDVTGALDSAAGFAGTGRVEYVTADAGDGTTDIVTVSTGSRARPGDAAGPATAAVDRRFARLFVKVDSTLRGSPAEHVRGALGAWHPGATAVVCPAAPALGRTVAGGRVLVDGVPAARTDAGRDPVAPAREDRLDVLFGAPLAATEDLAGLVGRLPAVVVDAVTGDDLAALARALDALGPRAVPVGAAGLAAALGALRPAGPPGPAPAASHPVVLATSVHPVARAQLAALGRDELVVGPPTLRSPAVSHDEALAAAADAAARAAHRIAAGADAVVVLGGDGVHALLAALGATGVAVRGTLLPGVPWGVVRGGPAAGLPIVTKAGGFGGPATLTDLIGLLTKEHG